VASLVLTAAMAPCLVGVGELKANAKLPSNLLAWTGALAMGGLCLLMLSTPIGKPSLELHSYPVQALAYIHDEGLLPPPDGSEGRLLAQDFVGNLREYLDGPIGDVFVDDRAEVLSKKTSDDYLNLLGAGPSWETILDSYDIRTIVWQRSLPLAVVLTESERWQVRYTDGDWIVATRRAPTTSA
ncbi:MAG TPA: hypothetical protein VMK16_00465, partial [Acidimicrobiales bacterium]|nr:hypothetical protein [Acidimicrobiales bacterium]